MWVCILSYTYMLLHVLSSTGNIWGQPSRLKSCFVSRRDDWITKARPQPKISPVPFFRVLTISFGGGSADEVVSIMPYIFVMLKADRKWIRQIPHKNCSELLAFTWIIGPVKESNPPSFHQSRWHWSASWKMCASAPNKNQTFESGGW